MTDTQYKLSSTLAGHAADVRALATAPPPDSSSNPHSSYPATQPVLFSSSRDGTARSWVSAAIARSDSGGGATGRSSGGEGWTEGLTFGGAQGHEGFVNAVEWLPSATGETESGEPGSFRHASSFLHRRGSSQTRPPRITGFLLTAGQDKLIHAWPLPAPAAQIPSSSASLAPSHTLIGHDANVCALHASENGRTIVSGSWDK